MRIERLPLLLAACFTLLAADEIPGWFKAGSHPQQYDMGRDEKVVFRGRASGFVKSNKPESEGFGSYLQGFDADEYRGKRVEFSAMVKAEAVANWSGLWMRIDGDKQQPLAFDNMQGRAIKGTSDWVRHSVVLDVAADAKAVVFGVLLSGKGSVWINDVRFEVVSNAVPVTDVMKKSTVKGPLNLTFEPK